MNKKSFSIYKGILLIEFIMWVVFIAILSWIISLSLEDLSSIINPQVVIGMFFFILFFTVLLLRSLRLLSYRLKIVDDILVESELFRKKREVNINSIKSIKKATYYLYDPDAFGIDNTRFKVIFNVIGWIFFILSVAKFNPFSSVPMITLHGNLGVSGFPRYPVNPLLIEAIININPNTTVDKDLADLLPSHLRNRLNLRLSVVDTIGLLIWRISLIIAFPLIFFFVVALLFGVISSVFNLY